LEARKEVNPTAGGILVPQTIASRGQVKKGEKGEKAEKSRVGKERDSRKEGVIQKRKYDITKLGL
jgi:hypothetical protein